MQGNRGSRRLSINGPGTALGEGIGATCEAVAPALLANQIALATQTHAKANDTQPRDLRSLRTFFSRTAYSEVRLVDGPRAVTATRQQWVRAGWRVRIDTVCVAIPATTQEAPRLDDCSASP